MSTGTVGLLFKLGLEIHLFNRKENKYVMKTQAFIFFLDLFVVGMGA